MQQRVVIIGAGVAGLVAAHRLRQDTGAEVIVLESADRPGGQLRTIDFLGMPVDVGAEALYLHNPVLAGLITELDLTEQVIGANSGTTLLAGSDRLRPLPAGVGPTGPTKLRSVARSGVLSPAGLLRAYREPLHTKPTLDSGDVSVGDFLTHRWGREVVDRLVAPMLANLHSGDIDRLSLRVTASHLMRAATEGTSLLRAKSAPRPTTGPAFASFDGGLTTFIDALAKATDLRLSTPALGLDPHQAGWQVLTPEGVIEADAVLITTPADVAADLLDHLAPVRSPLKNGRTARIASVLTAYPLADATEALARLHRHGPVNGVMVPPHLHRLMKAATVLGHKWPHLVHDDVLVVRQSAGRVGQTTVARMSDDRLAARVQDEFAQLTGLDAAPVTSQVIRWTVPQSEVGHQDRLRRIRNSLALLPPLFLAGAPYDGIGLGAVVQSGISAAAQIATAAPA